MSVLSIDKNAEYKTIVITAEYHATVDDVWQLWADPRLLERWWGPAEFATTFHRVDLTPGGTISYSMKGADADVDFGGTWNVLEVEAPTRLVVADAEVDDDGTPTDGNSMTRLVVDISGAGGTTRMTITTHFDSVDGMEHEGAGFAEGMRACMARIDGLLADAAA